MLDEGAKDAPGASGEVAVHLVDRGLGFRGHRVVYRLQIIEVLDFFRRIVPALLEVPWPAGDMLPHGRRVFHPDSVIVWLLHHESVI